MVGDVHQRDAVTVGTVKHLAGEVSYVVSGNVGGITKGIIVRIIFAYIPIKRK